jgi:hypothetical protein
MKKRIILLILMGVLVLESCTSYRVRVVTHPTGESYYFPQKREGVRGWEDLGYGVGGSYTKDWAEETIRADRNLNSVKVSYYNFK